MAAVGRLLRLLPDYARNAWWGLASPRLGRGPDHVVQAVVLGEPGVLLAVRADLRGWELPGGNRDAGESPEEALRRELREETGLEVEVERRVGDYHRSGFRPHVAEVFRCRVTGGRLRPSRETPRVAWWPLDGLPETIFPWFRGPLEDALAELPEPVLRREHQGLQAIWSGLCIDLRMRLSDDQAGAPPGD